MTMKEIIETEAQRIVISELARRRSWRTLSGLRCQLARRGLIRTREWVGDRLQELFVQAAIETRLSGSGIEVRLRTAEPAVAVTR